MKMEFYAEINETDNSEGVQMGHIELKMVDGETVWVDADETEWSEEEDGSFDILLRGVYIMGDEDDDYNVDPADFKGATITDIYIDDDTDEDYDITAVSEPEFW